MVKGVKAVIRLRRVFHRLWQIYVTPYEPSERWAGGLFPNQAKGEDTLPVWTKK